MSEKVTEKKCQASESGEICARARVLGAGEYLTLPENHVIANKQLTLSFTVDELGEDDVIRLGHGETVYAGSYLEITREKIRVVEYLTEPKVHKELLHGLRLVGRVCVAIDVGYSSASITLSSLGAVFESGRLDACWSGRNGAPFVYSMVGSLRDVTLRWSCSDLKKDIWLLGDSYFNPTSAARWTSYLVSNGYKDYLLSGFPGRDCVSAIGDFKQLLCYGTPKYAVWCVGMNNPDSCDGISKSYLDSTSEFISICKDKGIIPVLATIPCVPERINGFKNAWVRASGLRYVDFASAVGAVEEGSSWYDGLLSSDMVHPDVLGARALYAEFITDFPEIMGR